MRFWKRLTPRRGRTTLLTAGAVLPAMLLAAGCSDNSGLSQVRGRVTLDGQPLADATVLFTPVAGGSTSIGKTDSAGEYSLAYSPDKWGAEPGPHQVWISTASSGDADSDPPLAPTIERVPPHYRQLPGITVEVTAGRNEHDFPLETAGLRTTTPRF
jgi:hypothetical protein